MGFIMSAVGAAQQSSAMGTMAGFYSQQGQTNQQLADMSATDALQRGEQAAGQVQTKASQTIGAQTAGYASSGVDTSSGSPLQTMLDTRMMSAQDQAIMRNNAAREAFGYQVKGVQANEQGQLQAFGAQTQSQAAALQGAGDVLGGFTQLAGMKIGGGGGVNGVNSGSNFLT